MLDRTFIHIPGIGLRTELDLWRSGVRSWEGFDSFFTRPARIGPALRQRLETYVPQSIEALNKRDAAFFSRLTTLGEAWRLFPEFSDQCAFLDIETTGLSSVFDSVTVVGLFDGNSYEVFIDGQNLDQLPDRLSRYRVVVTFNGSGFDFRFLKLLFPDLALPPIHIDLRWITRRLGFRGGLKEIEKDFGIKRAETVVDIDGYDATVLWSRHLRGERSALERLISYNREDVVHLKAMMEMCYDQLAAKLPCHWGSVRSIYGGIGAFPKVPKVRSEVTKHETTIVSTLLGKTGTIPPTVVGIDLTGSEKRATGWALLRGGEVETRSITSDADLIRETVLARPDLVSIDSPLSVPEGWTRAQERVSPCATIYRRCELALKRMGISVFWCLLPSMQSLTMRGMRLADEFRRQGLPVIESYPGAAQDILGIPRKGSSLEELKWGLARAGITGPYLCDRVSHDEVDAVTSALVGLFYLAGDYLALGTPLEDYLIVPKSPRIHYRKLTQVIAASGLDSLSIKETLECGDFHAESDPIPAFA